MTFDPFGDFATRGYLRNIAKVKDPEIVQRLQHNSFLTGIDAALAQLQAQLRLGYGDVLRTHTTLFEAVFRGPVRTALRMRLISSSTKDPVLFAHPNDIRKAVDYALEKGQDRHS